VRLISEGGQYAPRAIEKHIVVEELFAVLLPFRYLLPSSACDGSFFTAAFYAEVNLTGTQYRKSEISSLCTQTFGLQASSSNQPSSTLQHSNFTTLQDAQSYVNHLGMSALHPEIQQFYENQIAQLQARNAELEADRLISTRAQNRHLGDRNGELDDDRSIASAGDSEDVMSISDHEVLEVDDLRAQNEKLARELEMEREMGRRVVATKFVEEVCGRVQPDLMQKLADSERDKKELKKLNAQLIREVDRLLWDRSRVANKYSTLYRRERDDCKELKRRLGLYRTSLLSRIEVSQRYAVSLHPVSFCSKLIPRHSGSPLRPFLWKSSPPLLNSSREATTSPLYFRSA
jgi:hypothetical protein